MCRVVSCSTKISFAIRETFFCGWVPTHKHLGYNPGICHPEPIHFHRIWLASYITETIGDITAYYDTVSTDLIIRETDDENRNVLEQQRGKQSLSPRMTEFSHLEVSAVCW